jgi:predicted outer membrane repeat protein
MIIFLAILGCANAADNETTDLMAVDDTIDSAPIANGGTGDFSQLNDTISKSEKPEIKLETDYIFNSTKDGAFKLSGINITRDNLVIDGNDHTIDGSNKALIFHVYANNVTLKNIRFINSWGAVEFEKDGSIEGSKFINNSGRAYGGAVIFKQNGVINGCEFENNSASYGGAVYFKNKGSVENSKFTDNSGTDGGAVLFSNEGSVENCMFVDNTASNNGGSVKFNQNATVIILVSQVVVQSVEVQFILDMGESSLKIQHS